MIVQNGLSRIPHAGNRPTWIIPYWRLDRPTAAVLQIVPLPQEATRQPHSTVSSLGRVPFCHVGHQSPEYS